jgi:chromosome segregation ATPase
LEELQNRITQLESEKEKLDPNVSDDNFRIRQINAEIDQINTQLAQQKAAEDQKFDELKAIVEAANLNEVLGHPDAAKIVHAILYDQSLKHLAEIAVKDAEIVSTLEQITTLEQHYTHELQQALSEAQKFAEENVNLKSEIDLSKNESRNRWNEAERLKQQVSMLNQQLESEKTRRSELKPSGNLQELLADAKAVTEQRKVKITNVLPTNEKETHYTATTETGEQVTIPHYALNAYEKVERLPIPVVTEEQFLAGSENVEEPAVAQENTRDTGSTKVDEEVQEPTLEDRVKALEVWRASLESKSEVGAA